MENDMELRHIRYFLAVAEDMNFTQAAKSLCIAQPPLSRQIQDLEEELGCRLFLRKPHSLQLTEEGILFRQYAVQVMDLVGRSVEELHEMKNGLQGTVYLASVEGSAPRLLSCWIAAFHQKYPQVQYQLWNGNSDDVVNRVMKGLCDMAVIMEPHNEEGLYALPVYKEPWIAMIPLSHPLAAESKDTVALKQLAPYDLLIPSRQSRLQEISSWFGMAGFHPKVRCRFAHMLNAYELTKQGVGIAIYPASSGELTGWKDICIKQITEPDVTASYILIRAKNRQLPLAAQEFLDFVKSEYLSGFSDENDV